nr:nuclear pore complex protein Nup153 isoform X1 [Onthophagus taurus]
MATENDLSFGNESVSPEESASNKSFVKKVTSRVSGFLPSSLSKWFAGTESTVVRPRDETDDDDETLRIQPPTKKAKTNEPAMSSMATSLYKNNHRNARHLFVAPRAEIDRTKNNNNNNNANCIKFPEPVAGPSGYSMAKTNTPTATKASLNMSTIKTTSGEVRNYDYNSDSGESTSGYSSMRVGSKEMVAESSEYVKKKTMISPEKCKTLFNTPSKSDRSLFGDRTISPDMNTSLSTRQPTFNSTAFAGTANFVDRTLSSKRILDSPFYSGRTTYGGASAYGRRMADRSHDSSSAIVRNSIQIKPVNEKKSESTSLSKTAKRILDTLEQYTAPAEDAKKIPNPPKNPARYTNMNHPYAIRETKVPSNRELQVPTVPDLLKMKLKEKMQNTTVSVRKIANSSKCSLNTEEYKIVTLDEDNTSKHMNKMKNKISSVRESKPELNETVKEVKLPDVKLPITTLPVFNFSIPAPPSASSSNISKPTETISSTTMTVKTTKKITDKSIEIKKIEEVVKETAKKDNNRTEQNTSKSDKKEFIKQTEYVFSNPRILSEKDGECKVCLVRNKSGEPKCNSCTIPFTTTINGTNEHTQKYTYTFADPVPVEDNNKTTSKPMFKSDLSQFKMSVDKWECGTCLVRNNNSENTCIACATPKVTNGSIISSTPATKALPKITFGQFQPPSGTWECSVCMIRNKNDRKTCEACTSPKPVPKQENGIQGSHDTKSVDKFKLPIEPPKYPGLNNSVFKSDLLEKFKPASDTWECSVCMVRNKNAVSSCVACTTPKKENGFGDQFKKKDDQWECGSCMVRNSAEKLKCICCDAPKPGSNSLKNVPKETTSAASFNFGIVNNEAVGKMFTFNKPFENTQPKPPSLTGSIFGQQSESKTETPKFIFGINPTETKKEVIEPSNKVEKSEEKVVTLTEVIKPIVTSPEITTKSAPIIKPTLNGDMNKTPLLFGNVSKPAETKPTFSFGISPKPTETTESKSNLPVVSQPFVFGNVTSTPSTSLINLSSSMPSIMSTASTSAIATPTPHFVFEKSAEKSTFRIQQTDKPSFLSVDSPGKPTFGVTQPVEKPTFGATQPVEKPTFGATQPIEKPTFGATQPVEKPTFGTPSTEKLTFGVPQTTGKPPVFGMQTGNPNFGVQSAGKPTFGVQPTEKPGLFGNASIKATTGSTKFGSSGVTPQSGIGGFNFGSTPVNQTAPAQNGTFSFGKPAANTSTTTFNFGSQQKPLPGVFNFGSTPSTSTAPSTSGGFNFSAAPEFQPNFNFTTGAPPSAFNSPSTGGNSVQERRVIRRALRRTQR